MQRLKVGLGLWTEKWRAGRRGKAICTRVCVWRAHVDGSEWDERGAAGGHGSSLPCFRVVTLEEGAQRPALRTLRAGREPGPRRELVALTPPLQPAALLARVRWRAPGAVGGAELPS